MAEIKEDIKDLSQDRKINEKVFLFFVDKCREEDFLLNRLRQSLYQKMEREGTLPQKEQYRNFKNQRQNEQEILDKIIADAGLIRLENGQLVEKGKRGDKGEMGKPV